MKLLWIGEHSNDEIANKLVQYGYKTMSITVAQDNLIKGIQRFQPIDTISGCRLPPAKKFNKLFFKGSRWKEKDNSNHTFVDLLNIKYLEMVYKRNQLKKASMLWAKENHNNKCHVIVYGLHSPYLACIPIIKKIVRDCTVTCIVPDLPELYDFHMSMVKKILKKIDAFEMVKYIKYIDKYVLFAESMANYLDITQSDYITMEGSINVEYYNECLDQEDSLLNKNNNVVLLYTGAVSHGYGLDRLLEAFNLVNKDNYELWIAGSGNAVDMIKSAALTDKRIKYLGHISRRSELIRIQKRASLMMNMIPLDNEATKFCFPSKLFEYMLSGNPTLTFKLEGIKEEYFEYLHVFDDTSIKGIANKIIEVGELSETDKSIIGNKAREFIAKNKNNYLQARRILSFIDTDIFENKGEQTDV